MERMRTDVGVEFRPETGPSDGLGTRGRVNDVAQHKQVGSVAALGGSESGGEGGFKMKNAQNRRRKRGLP